MDEQLKRELQEALYGALAAIYESNKSNSSRDEQDQKIEIVVSGDSLSLIKSISEDSELDNKITKVAKSFEMLNGQLRDFDRLEVLGPEGSFTSFVNFISLLASIPDVENLNNYNSTTGKNIANFLSSIAQVSNGFDAAEINSMTVSMKSVIDMISDIVTSIDGLNVRNAIQKMPDISSLVQFVDTFTDPGWIEKIEKATTKLEKRRNQVVIKDFLKAVASIFDDDKIKNVFFKDPSDITSGQGVYGLIAMLNWFTQDKFFSKLMKANLAVRLGSAGAIKKFFKTVGSIYISEEISGVTRERVEAIGQILKLLDSITSIGFLFRVYVAGGFLSYDLGKSISSFFNGFVENLTKIRMRDYSKAAKVIETTSELIWMLTKSVMMIGALSLVIALTKPFSTLMIMTAVVGMEILLIKTILENTHKYSTKDSIKGIESINKLVETLTISMMAIAVTGALIKAIGEKSVIEALGLFFVVSVAVLGLAYLLSKSKALVKDGKKGAEGLAIMVAAIGVCMILIAFTGMLAKSVDKDGLLLTGVILLATMGIAMAIGFFWKKEGKDAMLGLVGLTALILGLGLNLMILATTALMLKSVSAADWGILMGIVLAEVILFTAIGIASKTGMIGQQAIKGVVELIALMTGLSLNLLILTATALLARNVTKEDLGILAALIAGELAVGYVLLRTANSKLLDKPLVKEKLALLELLLLGLSVNALIATEAAKNAKQVDLADLGKLALILAGEIGFMTLLATIGSLASTVSWGLGILEVLLGGLLGISWLTIQVAKAGRSIEIKDVEKIEDIMWSLLKIAGVLEALSIPMAVLAPLVGVLEVSMAGMLMLVSKQISIISKMIDVARKYKDAKAEGIDIKTVGEDISAAMSGFIHAMSEHFGNPLMNVWYTIVNVFFTTMMMPMLLTVSTFIDVIGKVAKMSFIVGYDDNGKPIYERIDPSVFGKAASNVTTGFGSFVNTLADYFRNMSKIGLITIALMGDVFNPIMNSVGSFVDAILKLATATYVVGYDDNGKPTYEKVDPSMFDMAATVVCDNFKKFLSTLVKEANKLEFLKAGAVEAIGNSMKPAMEGVSAFADAILKLATGQYIKEYDSNGKPVYDRATNEDYIYAAVILTTQFSSFLQALVQGANDLDFFADDSIEAIGKSMKPVMEGVGAFADAILKVAAGTYVIGYDANGNPINKKITNTMFRNSAIYITALFKVFMRTMISESNKLTEDQQKALKSVSDSIGPLMSSVGTFTDSILKLATGTYIKGYDKNGKPEYGHIEPNDYIQAAKTLTDAMGTFIDKLTEKLDGDLKTKSADVINKLTKGGLKDMMDALAKFTKILSSNQFAVVGYDKDGHPIYEMEGGKPVLASIYYKDIAKNIVEAISSFITTLDSNLTISGEEVKSLTEKIKNIRNVFDPINKFTNAMKAYSETLKNVGEGKTFKSLAEEAGTNIHVFFESLYGADGTKLDIWASKIATIDKAKTSLDKSVSMVLLLKQLVGLNIDEVNKNITKFHEAIDNLLTKEFAAKTESFSANVDKLKTILDDLRSQTIGLDTIGSEVVYGTTKHLNLIDYAVNNIVIKLTKFDNKVIDTALKLQKARNTFTETVDKINAKLKNTEGERNRMLTELTTHLDTIGKKLQTISAGLKEINASSMDKVEQLAKVFAEMQQQQLQMFIESSGIGDLKTTSAEPVPAAQPAQTSNNVYVPNNREDMADNYFGSAFQFEIKEGTPGLLRGIMKKMV